jgi:hypothetical protein
VRREEEKKLAYPSRGPHLRAMASASKTLFLALLWLSSGQLSFKILYLKSRRLAVFVNRLTLKSSINPLEISFQFTGNRSMGVIRVLLEIV